MAISHLFHLFIISIIIFIFLISRHYTNRKSLVPLGELFFLILGGAGELASGETRAGLIYKDD